MSVPAASAGTILIADDNRVNRLLLARGLEQEGHTLAILEIGGMHHHFEQQTHRIDKQVTFAPVHFLPPVISMRPTALRRFDRLAIDDRCARLRVAADAGPQLLAKHGVRMLPTWWMAATCHTPASPNTAGALSLL